MGTKYIVSIGISNYPEIINKLYCPAEDARVISWLFKDLGFTDLYAPICDEKATKNTIERLVLTDLDTQLKSDDTLVFFFAGHGRTRVDEELSPEERLPFLIPYDAICDEWQTYIDLDSLLRWISKLPAKHILVILNACKSGLAFNSLMKKPGVIGINKDLDELASRKIITSATHLQDAKDGKEGNGEITPFALSLVEGINSGLADYDNDGEISWDELGLFLKQSMKQKTNNMQIPDYGNFHNDDNGNFIILLNPEDKQIKIETSTPDSPKFIPQNIYDSYLSELRGRGDISKAIEDINRLKDMKMKEGLIPLSHHDLNKLFWQLESWQMLLSVPEQEFPPVKLFQQEGNNMYQAFFDGANWWISEDAIICLKIANTASKPIYTYMIQIDGLGRLSQVTLWDDENTILRGLGPGEEKISLPFRHFGMSKWGLGCQMRIFSSPHKIKEFTYPTLSDFCNVEQSKINSEGVRMKVVSYTILQNMKNIP